MLSITPSGSAQSAKDYFANSLSKGDYYLRDSCEEVEITGQWHGKLADSLGIEGQVTQEQFNDLVDNINPATAETLTSRNCKNRIAGWDFTFNAPKSLSILYEITQNQELLDVFRDSVTQTMGLIESDMETRIRKDGENDNRTTGNMLWAEFIHTTSRPVDGVADPHLHIHAFAMNATLDEQEQQIKAAKIRNIKRDGNYYEAHFHSVLTDKLTEMGLSIEREGRFWNIEGFDRQLIEKFSNRTQQIEQTALEYGITNNDNKADLARFNRETKNDNLSKAQLMANWLSRLSQDDINTINNAYNNQGDDDNDRTITHDQAKAHAMEHVFERSSVVSERKLQEEALRFSFGSLTPDQLDGTFSGDEFITRQIKGETLTSTQAVLDQEKLMVDFARDGMNQSARLNPNYEIQPQTDPQTGKQWHFEGEAKQAIEHILNSYNRVIALQGYAGTGKTTLMNETINGIQQNNKHVFTFAPSSSATGKLKEEGFQNSHTVARLLVDEELQASLQKQVIWIDEAGLLSVPQMKAVFDIAEQQNARVILGGDSSQHTSVERGDAYRVLQEEAHLTPAIISDIRRQKPKDYKQAITHLAKGEIKEGFDILDKRGSITEINSDERYLALANDYVQSSKNGNLVLVVSPTHAEAKKTTDEIRLQLKEQGKIGQDDHDFTRYQNLNLTTAQRKDVYQYKQGDIIGFVQNATGFKKGEKFEVIGPNDQSSLNVKGKDNQIHILDLEQAQRFQVYYHEEIQLAKGDHIRITENSTTTDGKHKLNNGTIHKVAGFTREGDIRTKDERIIKAERGNFTHGFVTTSHSAQGHTVDKVIIAQSSQSFGAASTQQFYVSASRGREDIQIYTDDKNFLLEAASQSGQRLSAIELEKTQQQKDFATEVNRLQFYQKNLELFVHQSIERPLTNIAHKTIDKVRGFRETILDQRQSPPELER